jgi:hypothetical protein
VYGTETIIYMATTKNDLIAEQVKQSELGKLGSFPAQNESEIAQQIAKSELGTLGMFVPKEVYEV